MSVSVKNLSYSYSVKTPYRKDAVKDVSFELPMGGFIGIVGATGSGKSTLIQHLNALIKPMLGKVNVLGFDPSEKKCDLRALRSKVGMLFQYPEYQLFDETVLKDVCFAPLNFGMTRAEAEAHAREAIELVGLDFDTVKEKSPFELSGGEKRRAAIAGIIAVRPKILIMDEPTAGLDPIGKREILALCKKLKTETVETVIIISHNMDEIAEFCDRILVMQDGRLVRDTTPTELFSDAETMEGLGLSLPHSIRIKHLLERRGIQLSSNCLSPTALSMSLQNYLNREKKAPTGHELSLTNPEYFGGEPL